VILRAFVLWLHELADRKHFIRHKIGGAEANEAQSTIDQIKVE
jgi:hypothetical protein